MPAVSNTSPISNLAAIGQLDLLRSQFQVVWIPEGVRDELAAHPMEIARNAIQKAIAAEWIKVAAVGDTGLLRILLSGLHRGEAEAIALAASMGTMVLIDEQEGRQVAVRAGLRVTGVLGVLLRAKSTGTLPEVKPVLELLRSRAGFFVSRALETKVLLAAGE